MYSCYTFRSTYTFISIVSRYYVEFSFHAFLYFYTYKFNEPAFLRCSGQTLKLILVTGPIQGRFLINMEIPVCCVNQSIFSHMLSFCSKQPLKMCKDFSLCFTFSWYTVISFPCRWYNDRFLLFGFGLFLNLV